MTSSFQRACLGATSLTRVVRLRKSPRARRPAVATGPHLLKNPAMNRRAAAAFQAAFLAASFALAASWSCAPRAPRSAHASRPAADQPKLQRHEFNQSGVGVD